MKLKLPGFPALRGSLGRLSARDRRAIVIGTWVTVTSLVLTSVVRPLLADFQETGAEIEEQRGLLQRERDLLALASQLPASQTLTTHRFATQRDRLFTGRDAVTTTAVLSRFVSERATASRVFVQSTESRPSEAVPGFTAITMDVRAISDLRGIIDWLSALETGRYLLHVGQLRIAPAQRLGRGDEAEEEVLSVTLRITGFMIPDSASALAAR
jgi:hypothetical protein